jgi:hypothetical protein
MPEGVENPIGLQAFFGKLRNPLFPPPVGAVTAGAMLRVEPRTVVSFQYHFVEENVQCPIGMIGNRIRDGVSLRGSLEMFRAEKDRCRYREKGYSNKSPNHGG